MSQSTIAIVGSGIVGTAIAYKLTQQGYDVTIFEKGPEYPFPHSAQFQEEYLYHYKNPQYQLAEDLKNHTLTGTFGGQIEEERYMLVGGSATHWEGITPRLRPNDFNTSSLFGFGVDWPLSYEDLEPYYTAAEAYLGISGTDEDNPFAPPRSQPYPLPPFELAYDDKILADRLRQHDILLHTTPQARTRLTYKGRPGCINYGACYVCPIGVRYSPNFHLLQAVATGLCTIKANVSVRRIMQEKPGQATGLVYQANDSTVEEEHAAKVVIVACGGLESPRLLLLSANSSYPDGLGNQGGQVGQNLLFHHLWGGQLHYDDLLYPDRVGAWTGQMHQFLDPPDRGKHGGIKIEFSSRLGYFLNSNIVATWQHGAEVVEALQPSLNWRWMAIHAESVAAAGKYVALSAQKDRFGDPFVHINYEPVEFDAETYTFAKNTFAQIQAASGAIEGRFWEEDDFNSAAHHMGTCRMGHEVGNSVVNSVGQVHEISNLLVVGSSNFVTSGAINPTLTMTALAIRSADFILDQLL